MPTSLTEYRGKRDFTHTPEPWGDGWDAAREPLFVVQKHDASRLHYDFRLQVDGVLKSWAVPRGPSLNTREKRLAIPTEDHPLEYANFEGIIPEGQYGAGRVIVWDIGTYRNITKRAGQPVPLDQAIENGQLAIWLDGQKLKGGFALTRIRNGKKPIWLLVKKRDEYANAEANLGHELRSHPMGALLAHRLREWRVLRLELPQLLTQLEQCRNGPMTANCAILGSWGFAMTSQPGPLCGSEASKRAAPPFAVGRVSPAFGRLHASR